MNILFLLLSLVKMVYKMAEEHRREPRWPEVEHAIRRNFGGLDEIDAVKVFRKYFRGQFSLGRSDTVGVLFSVTAKLVWFLDGMLCIPFRGLKCVLVPLRVFSFKSSTVGAFAVPLMVLSQKKYDRR